MKWAMGVLGVVFVALVVLYVLAVRQAREEEARKLEQQGFIVAHPLDPALVADNEMLQAEVKRLRALVDAKPTMAVRAVTKPAPAQLPVAQGEQLRLKVDEVLLKTIGGNQVLVGTASVEKQDGALVLRAPFSQETKLTADTPVRSSKWGFGPWLSAGSDGWVVGAAVAVPEVRVFGVQVELSAGAGLGPNGKVAGAAQLIVR